MSNAQVVKHSINRCLEMVPRDGLKGRAMPYLAVFGIVLGINLLPAF